MSSVTGERKLKILASGKGFRLLSSTLYQNKPLAMAREIIHNALDAHRAVGKEGEPFCVHIPTKAEPFFAVRDFGPSIRDEDMADVYGTYFNSTKPKNGTQFAGRLGLGTKAPFTMTNSFTVTTFLDGTKRIYTIFYGENDEPAISPPLESATTEANGLEVHVKIEPEDIAEVRKSIRAVLAFFDPMPILINDDGFARPTPPDYYLTGEDFGLRVGDVASYSYRVGGRMGYSAENAKARAIMGHIAYPIEINLLSGFPDDLTRLLKLPFDLHFPLGALEFVPSREALSYEKELTFPSMRKALRALKDKLQAAMDGQFEECPTEGAARRKYATLSGNEHYQSEVLKLLGGVNWRGQIIDGGAFSLPKGLVAYSFVEGRRRGTVSVSMVGALPAGRIHVYMDDRDKPSNKLVHAEYRDSYNARPTYMLSGPLALQQAFLARLDHVETSLTSELVQEKVQRKLAAKRLYNRTDPKLTKEGMFDYTPNMERGGFYVVLKNNEMPSDSPVTRVQWERAYVTSYKTGLFDVHQDEVLAVPATLAKLFEKHPKWKPFHAEMRERAKKLLTKAAPWLTFARYDAAQTPGLDYTRERRIEDIAPLLPSDHPFRVFRDTVYAWEFAYNEKNRNLRDLANAFGLGQGQVAAQVLDYDPKAAWEGLAERYPMLDFMIRRNPETRYDGETGEYVDGREDEAKVAAEYIALVDRSTAPQPNSNVVPMKPRERFDWRSTKTRRRAAAR